MNILELCTSPGFGGLELYAINVTTYLNQAGHSVNAVCAADTMIHDRLQKSNIKFKIIRVVNRFLPVIAALRLARYIDKHRIDVMHMHWGKDLLFAVLAKKFARRDFRLVYTRQMALTRFKHDWYHRFLYRNVDCYIVITRQLMGQASKYLTIEKDRIKLLYYGVVSPIEAGCIDCAQFYNEYKIPHQSTKIALFGRIEELKGQHLLIEAVNQLKQKGHAVHASLVGHIMDEDYFNGLQQTVNSYGLQQEVSYLGFHDNPVSMMPCFDIVVLATKCETFGLVLIEAMRSGVVVIGSDCGGVPEIIDDEDSGLLFKSGSAESLFTALDRLVSDPHLRAKMAAAGKFKADKEFAVEEYYPKLLCLLKGESLTN